MLSTVWKLLHTQNQMLASTVYAFQTDRDREAVPGGIYCFPDRQRQNVTDRHRHRQRQKETDMDRDRM